MTNTVELTRLLLQIERDLVVRGQLRLLLTAADSAVASGRLDLRNLKARMARQPPGPGRHK